MKQRPSHSPSCDEDAPCAIKVVVRARPLSERELQTKTPVVVSVSRSRVQVVNPILFSDPSFLETVGASSSSLALSAAVLNAANTAGECRSFNFDRCFGDSITGGSIESGDGSQRPTQELIFNEIGQSVIDAAFQGFNCTMLAYGQTGSGKTHTMVGDKTSSGKGVIPRVCEALFQEIEARRDKEAACEEGGGGSNVKRTIYGAQVSYCEIYKEKVNDLLDTEATNMEKRRPSFTTQTQTLETDGGVSRRTLKVREHPVTGPFVEGLSVRSVTSYADIAEEMLAGEKLRTVASTLMNAVSSRSHAVFTITFTQTTFDPISQCANDKTSKISMIDLAGSERANVSGTSGDRLKEGAMINKSLTTLGRVISALSKQETNRIPYRDSTLTWLLKESLGGNAKTTMFAMISPSSENYDETMSTLRYAESAKKVMNRAVVNEDKNARIIRQLRQEIEELRAQLAQKEGDTGQELVNAGISASLVERETFYTELQNEVEFFRSQQKHLAGTTAPRAIHLSDSLPSLVNMSANLVPGEALAYVLVEGTTLFGSDPNPDMTKYETVEVQNDHDDFEVKKHSGDTSDASTPPKLKKRQGSWSSIMLRRRKSSRSAPSTPSGKASRKGATLDASEVILALSSDKRSVMQVCKLPGDDVSRILPRHARFTCTRILKEHDNTPAGDDTPEYIVEIESLDPTAILLVNGQPLEYGGEHPAKLHHGDQVRLGKPYCFRIHVPGCAVSTPRIAEAVEQPPELENDKDEGRDLEALVDEANAICTKWVLNTEFAVGNASDEENEGLGTVIVTKKLESNCCSTVHWDRSMLEIKLQFLREFAASLENVASFIVEEAPKIEDLPIPEPASKVAVSRQPSRSSGLERRSSRVQEKSNVEKTENDGLIHHSKLQLQTMPSLRLLGYGRIYVAAQTPESSVPLSVAIYDFSGIYIGKLEAHLEGVSTVTVPGKKKGILSSKEPDTSMHRVRVHLDKMEFDTGGCLIASSISITLKETASKANAALKGQKTKEAVPEEAGTPKIFSTPRVPPVETSTEDTLSPEGRQETFLIGEQFETSVTVKANNLFSQRTAEEGSLLVEVWGYDVKLTRYMTIKADEVKPVSDVAMETQRVEFYVSVDVEEREVDGLYHPVAVKPDGALRLHANRSRRLMVRVTQSDQQNFALSEIVHVRIAAPDAPSVNRTASMSRMMGKTTQRMLPSIRMQHDDDQSSSAASGELHMIDQGATRWQVLEFRGDCGVDNASRSLSAILRWDRAPDSDLEPINSAGTRSTYRLAIAFSTSLSKVPIVISKSLVAKVCGSSVSATQRFTRGLVASRTVWWAKESYSRSYRLGTWYAADIMPDDKDEYGGPANDDQPEGVPKAASINDVAIARHLNGLHRLESAMQLERVRQKVWIMINVSARQGDGNNSSVGESLTPTKVNLCLDEIFQRTEDEVQVYESVQFDSPELYIRHMRRMGLIMSLFTGKLVNLDTASTSEPAVVINSSPQQGRGHILHFVSEPTQLVGGDQLGGEMSGFLMLALASSMDEETAAAVVAPLGNNTARPMSPPKANRASKMMWERQWFVLKRPFLYAYVSFARKQQTGVMDLSLCQLIVSTTSDVPFSFRLVCVDGRKQSAVWWLQASTSAEMRAWLVAIDPLKIEARKSVVATPPPGETPAVTA